MEKEIMNTLIGLVDQYGANKQLEKSYKDLCSSDNDKIKELLVKNVEPDEDGKRTFMGDTYKVTYSVTKKDELNEEKALKILKKDWTSRMGSMQCPYIKTVQVLDMEALENALYNGEIDDSVKIELNEECYTVKETPKLVVAKIKKK